MATGVKPRCTPLVERYKRGLTASTSHSPEQDKLTELFTQPKEEDKERGKQAWRELMLLERAESVLQLSTSGQEPSDNVLDIAEAVEFLVERLRRILDLQRSDELAANLLPSFDIRRQIVKSGCLLAQTFEGKLIDVDGSRVTIEFDMGSRRELRQFRRAELGPSDLHPQDIVQMRCELRLALPTTPLSEAEVNQWMQLRADRAAAQAETKRPKSLLEHEQ